MPNLSKKFTLTSIVFAILVGLIIFNLWPKVESQGSTPVNTAKLPPTLINNTQTENRHSPLFFQGKTPVPERALMQDAGINQRLLSRRDGIHEMPWFSNEDELTKARQNSSLFEQLEDTNLARQSPLATQKRLDDDRLWIQYNMDTLSSRTEGDRLQIDLPKVGLVNALIENVEAWEGGYRWSGILTPRNLPGSSFHITQVRSANYAIGTINTPMGQYALEIVNGIGWIVNVKNEHFHTEDNHRYTPSHPKYFIAPDASTPNQPT